MGGTVVCGVTETPEHLPHKLGVHSRARGRPHDRAIRKRVTAGRSLAAELRVRV